MRMKEMGERKAWRGGLRPVAAAIAVAVVLGGCSSVPDAANPVKWYENTVDLFTGDDNEATADAERTPAPNADKPFPNLATVPDRPQVSTAEERRRIAEGLVPDNERRRYAPEVARQGAPTNVLSEDRPAAQSASTTGPGAPATLPPSPVEAPRPAAVAAAAPTAPSAPAVQAPRALAPGAPPAPSMAPSAPPAAPRMAAAAPTASRPTMPTLTPSEVAPRRTRLPVGGDPFPTVVVSSSGVDEGVAVGATLGAEAFPAAPSARLPDAANARGQSIKVATIQFAHGSADLDARDRTILRNVVALQRERGGVIRVVGHASSRTANMPIVRHKLVNYDMSSERADAVARTLSQMGAKVQDIVLVAKADTDPLYYEFMPSGEAGNRRTEVYLDF